jgi:hypothetical protein
VTREPIYAAILTQLETLVAAPYSMVIPTISREFKEWSDVPASQQPAIFLVQEKEKSKTTYGQPNIWTLHPSVWAYATKDGDTLGVQTLNTILDAIEKILSPPAAAVPGRTPYVNTLGGLVNRCSVTGDVDISGGYLGDQAVARVSLEVVVPW